MEKTRITTNAFTTEYDGIQPLLINRVSVASEAVQCTVTALWDTGASTSCISNDLARSMRIGSAGIQRIKTPSGARDVDYYPIDIILPNDVVLRNVIVCGTEIGSQGLDLLVGMDVIQLGDFAVSNLNNETSFTFRIPSEEKADYTK